ncbi:MAG: RNA polymerase sigma factor [Saprospiraceae bacterium]|nr:RNA polymerase sigma factor [Saprospiraceae bacterium]
METERIIQGCKSGDRKCQEALVYMFSPRLLAVCRRYCKDYSLAEDALQETFINAFRYIHTYSGSGSFEGWLRRIAVTKSLEMQNKFFKLTMFSLETETNITESVIPDVYSTLGEQELALILKKLPENQYIVFNLYVVEGYSHQEIAQLLSIAEGSSRSLLSRARQTLTTLLANPYQQSSYLFAQTLNGSL